MDGKRSVMKVERFSPVFILCLGCETEKAVNGTRMDN